MTKRVYILKATPFDPDLSAEVTVYFTSDSHTAKYFSGVWIYGLSNAITFATNVFDGDFTGAAKSKMPTVNIAVPLSADQDILEYFWGGRDIEIYEATVPENGKVADLVWGDYTILYNGQAKGHSIEGQSLQLTLHDVRQLVEKPLLAVQFAGTGGNNGALEVKGQHRPFAGGNPKNCPVVWVERSILTFMVHHGVIDGLDTVYDNGNVLPAGVVNHANYSDLADATGTPGTYDLCPSQGVGRLFEAPAGEITADVRGAKPNGTWLRTTADLIEHVLTGPGGLDSALIDSASFTAFNAVQSAPVSFYFKDQVQIPSLLNSLMVAVGGYWLVDPAGKIVLGRIEATGAITTHTEFVTIPKVLAKEPPTYRRVTKYARNYMVQSADTLGLPSAGLGDLATEDVVTTGVDGNVQNQDGDNIVDLSDLDPVADAALVNNTADINTKEPIIVKSSTAPGSPSTGDKWHDSSYGFPLLKSFDGQAWEDFGGYDVLYVNGVASATVQSNSYYGYQLSQPGTTYKVHQDSLYQQDISGAFAYGESLSTLGLWSEYGYELGQSGSSYKVHQDSLYEVEFGNGWIGGKNAALAMNHATDVVGSEYDDFADGDNWTPSGSATEVISGGSIGLVHSVDQTAGYLYWKEVAKGGVHEKIEFDTDSIASESGFLIGGTYVRYVSGTWHAPSGDDTSIGVTQAAHHEFLLKPDNTFDWLVDDVLVASDIAFNAGGQIGLMNEGTINTSPVIRNWKHWNKPISTMFGDRVITGFDRFGNIIRGNPDPTENMLDYDCEQVWSGGGTTNHVYLSQGDGNSGDFERLGIKGGDQVTFSFEGKHSLGGSDWAALYFYTYDVNGSYISGGAGSIRTYSTDYERVWGTKTMHADAHSIKLWLREGGSGTAYAKNAMMIRGKAKTPFVRPPLRLTRDSAPNASYVMSPNTTVGKGATFSLDPLSVTDDGATSTIYFAACTMYAGGLSIALSAFSVSGLAQNLTYYLYFKTSNLATGTYTLHATTSLTDISKGDDRIFIDTIHVPSSGGASGGTGGGGGGIIYE